MQDITAALVAARAEGPWPAPALLEAHAAGAALAGLRVEWDSSAADEWVRVLATSLLIALLWVPGPLVIETSGHQEVAAEVMRAVGVTPQVVVVPHMDTPVLSLRPAEVWPEREWPAAALDPAAVSAHDLWYAMG